MCTWVEMQVKCGEEEEFNVMAKLTQRHLISALFNIAIESLVKEI